MGKVGGSLQLGRFTVASRFLILSRQRVFNNGGVTAADNTTYQTLPGYALLNGTLQCRVHPKVRVFAGGRNLLNRRYYNVNLGAAPEGQFGGSTGSAGVEFANGAPQYPLRISGGVQITL